MEPFITPIVLAIIAAIGQGIRGWLKTRLTPERMNTLLGQARIVVSATEQVANSLNDVGTPMTSGDKYAWAEASLKKFSKRLGLRLSDEELNSYIHAVLYEISLVEAAAVNEHAAYEAAQHSA